MDNAATDQMFTLRDYLATRRTIPVRHLGEPGPDQSTLDAILQIGARVPDHGKLVPWRFIVFSGGARKRVGDALAEIAHKNGATAASVEEDRGRFLRAPVVVAVIATAAPHPKIPEWEQDLSAGAVCMNLLHASAAMGFRAQWLTEWVAYDDSARTVLGVLPHEKVAGLIYIGTPSMPPSERARPDMSAIVTRVSE